MKRLTKLSLLLVLVALGTFVFIQCQKEGMDFNNKRNSIQPLNVNAF